MKGANLSKEEIRDLKRELKQIVATLIRWRGLGGTMGDRMEARGDAIIETLTANGVKV